MLGSQDVALAIAALAFAAMGAGSLLRPDLVTAQFDMPARTALARSEVRAVYGGFGVAVASVLAATRWAPGLRAGVCLTVAAALGGMAAGRVVSALVDRALNRRVVAYLLLELVVAGLAFSGFKGE